MKRNFLQHNAKLFLVATLVFSLSGCAARVKNVTNLPPGVTLQQAQNWDSAIADLHKIASTVSSLRQALVDLHNAGMIENIYYSEALRMIGNIDRLELSAETILRQSPQNFSASAKQQVGIYVQEISAQIQALNAAGATGIKNPNSLQTVNKLIGDLTAVVGLILSL
jgi:hypothetical protein